MPRRRLVCALALAVLTSGGAAAAADDLKTLQEQLGHEADELSTADCGVACRALASMQRTADRICALDPGPPCTEARGKVTDAESRVRAACPDCAVAASREVTATGAEPGRKPDSADAEQVRGGGCAGCAIDDRGPGGAGLLAALGALAAWLRRRRRPRV